ncbi:MAG: hypothetical protein ACK5O2_14050 [Microthrixaceae bacterium]
MPPEEDEKKGKGKLIAVLVVLLLLVAGGIGAWLVFGGGDDDDSEQADSDPSPDDADSAGGDATGELTDDGPIEFDTEYTVRLEGERIEARFTLDAPDSAIMTLEVSSLRESTQSLRTLLETPAAGRFVDISVAPGEEESEVVILDSQGGDTFELYFSGTAEFTFRVGLDMQDDAGQGADAGAELTEAFEVSPGSVAGLLGGEDVGDMYTTAVKSGTELTFAASAPAEAARRVRFVVEIGGSRVFDLNIEPGGRDEASMLLASTDSGEVEVSVSGSDPYEFTVGFVEVNDGGVPGDAPEELADARTVDIASPVTGSVGDWDEGDTYTFTAPGPTFNVTISSEATSDRSVRVVIEDAQGRRQLDTSAQPGTEVAEAVEADAGGEFRMYVTGGRAEYSVTFG